MNVSCLHRRVIRHIYTLMNIRICDMDIRKYLDMQDIVCFGSVMNFYTFVANYMKFSLHITVKNTKSLRSGLHLIQISLVKPTMSFKN